MGWVLVVIAVMSVVGAVLGAAGAYALAARTSTPRRTPARPAAALPALPARPAPWDPSSADQPASTVGPPSTVEPSASPTRPLPTSGTAVRPVAPLEAPERLETWTPPVPERTVPLAVLPEGSTPRPTPTRVLPAAYPPVPVPGPAPAAPPAAVTPRSVPPVVRRPAVLPPPGALRPATRGRGPSMQGADELAVHHPGGGVQRIGSGVLVGRADGCRVRFRISQVSRRHAVIYKARGRWWIGDLGSTNGTVVDGVPVVGAAELRLGSHVRVGGRDGIGFTVRPAAAQVELESPSAA